MNLKFTGTSIKQADCSTQGDSKTTPYRQLCFDLQSMTLVGKKAYCIKINKYKKNPDDPNDKKVITDKAEIHIYQDYSKGENETNHHYISINNHILGHANGVTYYNGALYVAVNSHGQIPEYNIVKVVLNSSETKVEEMVGYSLTDASDDGKWNLKVRGIAHYKDNQFILMINPVEGIHYPNKGTAVYNPIYFKIGSISGNTFNVTRTFYVKNIGEEITQDISYCEGNGRLYIVTCNKQDLDTGTLVTKNNVLELNIDQILAKNETYINKSQITFADHNFDCYVPSNIIVLNRLNSTQKIFELQSCCADTTNRRLVYAIDTKSTDKDATVQGEIYMVNNLLTKL